MHVGLKHSSQPQGEASVQAADGRKAAWRRSQATAERGKTNKYEEPIRHQEHFLFTQDFLAEDQSVR